MDIRSLECQRCGAPIKEIYGAVKCEYCGLEVIIESKKMEDISEKVKGSIQSSSYETQKVIQTGSESTQLELRRLQLTQELSSLQLQLSNLRMEKRGLLLSSGKSKAFRPQIREIEFEEKQLQMTIQEIHNILYSPQSNLQGGKTTSISSENRIENIRTMGSLKSQGVALILALTLGQIGAHRFYTGHTKLGLLYLFTLGIFGFGWVFDIFLLLFNSYKDEWGRPLTPMGSVAKKTILGFIIGSIIFFLWLQADPNASRIELIISYLIAAIFVNFNLIKNKISDILRKK